MTQKIADGFLLNWGIFHARQRWKVIYNPDLVAPRGKEGEREKANDRQVHDRGRENIYLGLFRAYLEISWPVAI
jgi:hypothetical protein